MKISVGKRFILTCLFGLGFCLAALPVEPTRVLVVATIHGNHESNANYSYQDLVNILAAYAPDAVCVEIRPEDFRKKSYLKEMMMATIFGLDRGLKVYPVDWWGSGDDRTRRSAYMKTPEFKAKKKEEERLVAENKVMREFNKKYGSLEKLWNANTLGYEFLNGEEYNRYIAEMYGVSMTVYGDGPMNLSYRTRNDKMMAMIRKAMDENPGRRITVLTGAEHKHYFDRALAAMPGVELVKLEDILPLRSTSPGESITRFLKDNLAYGYFDASTPAGVDQLYFGAFVPLVHGMGMDGQPESIPPANLPKTKPLFAEWQGRNPDSALLQFELAWVDFLAADYRQASGRLEKIRDRLDQVPEAQRDFVKSIFDRNLGLCHDLLGEREKAVACYLKGEAACRKLGFAEPYIKYLFRDFKDRPYQGKTAPPQEK
jgi:tetratricopeptide (TPR) repeat protein